MICQDIYEGKGFDILRGLDPDDWSVEDVTIIYLGIANYIGETRGKQDQRGSMISKYLTTIYEFTQLTVHQCISSSCTMKGTNSTVQTRSDSTVPMRS
jgi:hypothetical protein